MLSKPTQIYHHTLSFLPTLKLPNSNSHPPSPFKQNVAILMKRIYSPSLKSKEQNFQELHPFLSDVHASSMTIPSGHCVV